MKKTALIMSDLHIRPKEQLGLAKLMLKRCFDEVIKNSPTYLFILGDVFHYKDKTYASCLKVFKEFLKEVTKHTQVICLVGNHDWAQPYVTHSLDSYKDMPNCTIVEDIFRLDDDNVFISYVREEARFNELLKKLGPAKRLFGHLDINDFKMGSGWEEYDAYCNPEMFSDLKFEQVFSGHLHLAQQKVVKGTEIVYVGTGYTTDFGETDQFKRFILLDLETGKYDSIDTGLTLHKTLRIDATQPLPEIPKEEIDKNVNYRVIVKATKEQWALISKPKNYPATVIPDWVLSEGPRLDLSPSDSIDVVVEKYIKEEIKRSFGGEKASFDEEKLKKLGLNILSRFK